MQKLARLIVKYRLVLFCVFVGMICYCAYGITKITVEYDIATYLPEKTDTKRAIDIMNDEFAALGSATLLVGGVDKTTANGLAAEFKKIDGVTGVTFDADSSVAYKDKNALYTILFEGNNKSAKSVAAYDSIRKLLDDGGYDYGVPSPLVNDYAKRLSDEMGAVIGVSAAVILIVLLLTSKSFAEVLAFPVVFGVAALLNMGTNYWLGKISFVSNTVCIILQLALAIDYAIILCHRFTEEKDKRAGAAESALEDALAKAIPEIASSSLTTVSGLVALMFMQLGLGFDLGMVLAKSIICSLLTVFFLMPTLLLWLSKLMDKSRHKSFVPKVKFIGAGVIKLRYIIISTFVVLFVTCAVLSQFVTYCYSQNSITTNRPTATARAQAEANKIFGASNMFVILVPNTVGLDTQRKIAAAVKSEELVSSALGWAIIELPGKTSGRMYKLTDSVNYSDLGDITGISQLRTMVLFSRYAEAHGEDASDAKNYRVVLGSLAEYVFGDLAVMDLAGDEALEYKNLFELAKQQLIGKNHYRMVFNIGAAVEGRETFAIIERLTPAVKAICPDAIFAGQSMSAYDLNCSFKLDNLLIQLLTVAFIYVILAVTFRSWGIPIALVAIIQGAIFINFTIPVLAGGNVFFFVYLIASAIQMGATIDYAILMTNRFRQLRENMSCRDAVINAISEAFPTVLTSGTIMSTASFLVGFMTSDSLIASMGLTLGTGTVISIACVLTVLPALLYMLDGALEKTVIKKRRKINEDNSQEAYASYGIQSWETLQPTSIISNPNYRRKK